MRVLKVTFEIQEGDTEKERKLVEKLAIAFAEQIQRQRLMDEIRTIKKGNGIEVTD